MIEHCRLRRAASRLETYTPVVIKSLIKRRNLQFPPAPANSLMFPLPAWRKQQTSIHLDPVAMESSCARPQFCKRPQLRFARCRIPKLRRLSLHAESCVSTLLLAILAGYRRNRFRRRRACDAQTSSSYRLRFRVLEVLRHVESFEHIVCRHAHVYAALAELPHCSGLAAFPGQTDASASLWKRILIVSEARRINRLVADDHCALANQLCQLLKHRQASCAGCGRQGKECDSSCLRA